MCQNAASFWNTVSFLRRISGTLAWVGLFRFCANHDTYGSLAGACRVCDTGSGVLDKRGGTGRDKTALKTRVTASSCAIAKTAKSLKLDSETAPPEPPRRAPQPCRKLSPTTPAKRTSKQLEIALGRNYRWSDIHSRLSAFMRQRPAAPRFIKLPAVSFHRAFISRHTVRTRSLSDDGVPVVGAAARLAWVVARAEHSLRLRNVNTLESHSEPFVHLQISINSPGPARISVARAPRPQGGGCNGVTRQHWLLWFAGVWPHFVQVCIFHRPPTRQSEHSPPLLSLILRSTSVPNVPTAFPLAAAIVNPPPTI